MTKHPFFLSFIITLLLLGCGGGGDEENQTNTIPASLSPPANSNSKITSSGDISSPTGETSFSGNLLLSVQAQSDNGIASVALRFLNNGPLAILCDSNSACSGNNYADTVSGINPGRYDAVPGAIDVTLQVTDTLGQVEDVSSISLTWQPPVIDNVIATRNPAGTEVTVDWTANPELLRYNVYLASQTGVNKDNYQNLPNGQALLAVNGGPQSFTDLSPALDYFVLLTGIDGSGESTNLNEVLLPAIDVVPNRDPIANDDSVTFDEDESALIDVIQNDSDADGDPLTVISAVSAIGVASIQANEVLFEPPLNFNGDTTLDYTISDGRGGTANAQVTIQVAAINDPPEATDDFADTLQDTAVNVDVLANDLDIDGDALVIDSIAGGLGNTTIEADNTLTFDPQAGFVGTDSLDYTIIDGNGGTATATLSIDIGLVSQRPIANNDNYVVLASQLLTIDTTQGLLVNDADPDGDTISVVTQPIRDAASGTLTLSADGSFTYQPNVGFSGADSFEYQIMADNGQLETATVNLDVRVIPNDLGGDSSTMSGEFLYLGLGELTAGSGRGTGRYRIGDCIQDGNTRCHMLGNYTESVTSGNSPNQSGNYAFMQTYGGNGDSPVIAASTTAGSNVLSFTQTGDAVFELRLFPQTGGIVTAIYPDVPFANSLNFGAFIDAPQTCLGLPVGTPCNIGQVGLVNGAQLTAPLDRLNFSQAGAALAQDNNDSPRANLDSFTMVRDTTLIVDAPGILANDTDPDIPVIGDSLQVLSQFSPDIGALTAIGFNEYRQYIYTTGDLIDNVVVNDRLSNPITTFSILGERTNNVDIEIASETMQLAGASIPQGSFLFINGETGTAEIYAFDTDTGVLLAQLNTTIGNGDVVGGAYNPTTQTFFLLQETQAATGDPIVSEINPNSGAVLNQFSGAFNALDFDVGFGDIDINNETGSLYIIGSAERGMLELNPNGSIVRVLAIPLDITSPSGLAINQTGDKIWLSSTSGNVFELSFSNQGVLPQLQAELVVTTENGTLVTGRDGSFIYTPNPGFIGNEIFTYETVDRKGKNSLNNVRITVTN